RGDLSWRLHWRSYPAASHGEKVNLLRIVFLTLIVAAGTGGELCVSHAMKAVGEVHDFRPAALARFVWSAARVGWMWIGIGMMTVAFFSLRSEEHTSELQSRGHLVCRLLLEKKKKKKK